MIEAKSIRCRNPYLIHVDAVFLPKKNLSNICARFRDLIMKKSIAFYPNNKHFVKDLKEFQKREIIASCSSMS